MDDLAFVWQSLNGGTNMLVSIDTEQFFKSPGGTHSQAAARSVADPSVLSSLSHADPQTVKTLVTTHEMLIFEPWGQIVWLNRPSLPGKQNNSVYVCFKAAQRLRSLCRGRPQGDLRWAILKPAAAHEVRLYLWGWFLMNFIFSSSGFLLSNYCRDVLEAFFFQCSALRKPLQLSVAGLIRAVSSNWPRFARLQGD